MSAVRYAASQDAIASPRDIELRALHYVNGLLAAAGADIAARATALHKAHRMWSILITGLMDDRNALPPGLKGSLVSLGLWAQRESLSRLSDGESLQPLIALHRDLIEGLEAQARTVTPAMAPSPKPAAFMA